MQLSIHKVVIAFDTVTELELTQWCYEQFGSSSSGKYWKVYSTVWFSDDDNNNKVVRVAAFADDVNATHCKLAWL
jgi:hypothetical protein